MEFRFNLCLWTVMGFAWFGLSIAIVEVIFGQVSAIAGWTKNEILLLVFTQSLFLDISGTFIFKNLSNFSSLIRHGTFDFVLLKPINARFWVSTRFFEFDHYLRMIALILLINQRLGIVGVAPTVTNWLAFVVLFLLGVTIFYNMFFMIITSSFWFIRLFNLRDLFDEITDVGSKPVYIFKGGLRFFFTFILPVAYIATFPVQALLGKISFVQILIGIFLAVVTSILSEWFWHFALKHYSSASS